MDPSLRSTRRDAKEAVRDAQKMLRRGKKSLPEEKRHEIEDKIQNVKSCDGPSSTLAEHVRLLQEAVHLHLGFARKGKFREYTESIGIAVLVALTIRAFIFEPFKIPSPSMVPTLMVGDRIYVSKARYGIRIPFTSDYLIQWRQPARGDIVVFEFPRQMASTRDRIGQWMQYLATLNTPYPPTLQDVSRQLPDAFVSQSLYNDAWGQPLQYEAKEGGASYTLKSAGPDETIGTADDLTARTIAPSFVAFPDMRRPGNAPRLHRCPIDPGSLQHPKTYIKRVIGLPGDTVKLRHNQLYINGSPVQTTTVSTEPPQDSRAGIVTPTLRHETLPNGGPTYTTRTLFENESFGPITVPKGEFLALGDNRDESSDSRCWGFSPIERIRGQAKFVLFSLPPEGGVDHRRILKPLH